MDLTKIGRYIAGKRKELGLTQKQLAEKLGMSDKSVSKWETGVPKLKDTTLNTHAYIASKQYNFGGKPYEKADFLRI